MPRVVKTSKNAFVVTLYHWLKPIVVEDKTEEIVQKEIERKVSDQKVFDQKEIEQKESKTQIVEQLLSNELVISSD